MAKKKSNKKSTRKKSTSKNDGKMTKAGWFFINLLLIVMFLYALWLVWAVDWTQGLSLIVAVLIIVFVIRLFRKLKK